MKKNQQIVIDWFLNNETETFLPAIVELEGFYESIPDEVADAFEKLNNRERIKVIRKSASKLLKRMS